MGVYIVFKCEKPLITVPSQKNVNQDVSMAGTARYGLLSRNGHLSPSHAHSHTARAVASAAPIKASPLAARSHRRTLSAASAYSGAATTACNTSAPPTPKVAALPVPAAAPTRAHGRGSNSSNRVTRRHRSAACTNQEHSAANSRALTRAPRGKSHDRTPTRRHTHAHAANATSARTNRSPPAGDNSRRGRQYNAATGSLSPGRPRR